MPETRQAYKVRTPFGNQIDCRACGSVTFFSNGRSLDLEYFVCALCGASASCCTETGASA